MLGWSGVFHYCRLYLDTSGKLFSAPQHLGIPEILVSYWLGCDPTLTYSLPAFGQVCGTFPKKLHIESNLCQYLDLSALIITNSMYSPYLLGLGRVLSDYRLTFLTLKIMVLKSSSSVS